MTAKLTIGMAVFDDFNGVYFTIQALRLYHAEVMSQCEIVVVDNNPSSAEGQTTKDFMTWVRGDVAAARYIAAPEAVGTAAPRDRLFREAQGEAVLCLDCHVLLLPGSLQRLIDYYQAHPGCQDLLQGPLIYDDLKGLSTHFRDEWRAEMWGVWDSDPRAAGSEPFGIPMQGLGLFSMRRDAWPGFNPAFRGFGGEEGYIHTKVRQRGGRTLCLPWLRWVHRFGRPGGVKYPLDRWNKVRNYVIGHRELGLDLKPIHDHFVRTNLITQAQWDEILAGAEKPASAKGTDNSCGGCGSAPVPKDLETWYAQVRDTPSDLNEHVPTLRRLAEGCEHVVEFGHRRGISSVAILAGQPVKFTSYDLHTAPQANGLNSLMGRTQLVFTQGNSLETTAPEHDLLFLDTTHTAEHLYRELTRHAPRCRRHIALHDTVIFGEKGEDGGPGLLPGLRRFLREYPEWSVVEHFQNNNGFTVLSRDPADKPRLPGGLTMAWNYAKALAQHVATGSKILPAEKIQERLDVCLTCPQRVDNRCTVCGCFLDQGPDGKEGKALWADQDCPLGRWPLPIASGGPA